MADEDKDQSAELSDPSVYVLPACKGYYDLERSDAEAPLVDVTPCSSNQSHHEQNLAPVASSSAAASTCQIRSKSLDTHYNLSFFAAHASSSAAAKQAVTPTLS